MYKSSLFFALAFAALVLGQDALPLEPIPSAGASCEWKHKGALYNLTALMDQSYMYSDKDIEVHFSICENLKGLEHVPSDCEQDAAVCLKANGIYTNGGSVDNKPEWSRILGGVAVTVKGGDTCQKPSSMPIQSKTTKMEFICDKSVEELEIVSVEQVNDCDTVIRSKTQYACAVPLHTKHNKLSDMDYRAMYFFIAIGTVAIVGVIGIFAYVARLKREELIRARKYEPLLPYNASASAPPQYLPNYFFPAQWQPVCGPSKIEEPADDEAVARALQAQFDRE